MSTNIDRINNINDTDNVKDPLPQIEDLFVSQLFNKIEAYKEVLKDEEDNIEKLRQQLNEAQIDLIVYKERRRDTYQQNINALNSIIKNHIKLH